MSSKKLNVTIERENIESVEFEAIAHIAKELAASDLS